MEMCMVEWRHQPPAGQGAYCLDDSNSSELEEARGSMLTLTTTIYSFGVVVLNECAQSKHCRQCSRAASYRIWKGEQPGGAGPARCRT